MNKILYGLMAIVIAFGIIGASAVMNESKAGIFDDIADAFTGHVEDVKDRFKEDQIVEGDKKLFSVADWSSDSIHYIDGAAGIVQDKSGQKYVQLEEDFSAGLAPDLYVYLAPGHIKSDADFVNGRKMELGKLLKGSGASFYKIPKFLNGYSDEKFSVVIHCKRFNEPMGAFHFN